MKTRKIKSTGKKKQVDVGKKACQDANNARNRDSLGITKANFILEDCRAIDKGADILRSTVPNETEDAIIAYIDAKKAFKKL